MCGIAGIHVKSWALGSIPVDDLATQLLLGIEHRGRHATGLVSVGDGGNNILLDKNDVAASDFVKTRKRIPADARTVLLHTRWFTQGSPKHQENNHPVVYNTCFAVHNGHINNDAELFTTMDIPRTAEVDSVAIPACVNYHGIKDKDDVVTALEQLEGGMATAIIDPVVAPNRLVLAKGASSPLVVFNHPRCIIWASTQDAIKEAWARVIGTPSARKAKYDGTGMGWYDFKWGDLWIIDQDTIERERFKPAQVYRYSGGSSKATAPFCSPDDEYDDDYTWPWRGNDSRTTRSNWERLPGGGMVRTLTEGTSQALRGRALAAANADAYGTCYACDEDVPLDDLVVEEYDTGRQLICVDCLIAIKPSDDEPKGRKPLSEYERISYIENQLNKWVCKELAWELGTTPDFVNWVLFQATEEELEDVWLTELRGMLDKEYDNAVEIVRITRGFNELEDE